MAVIPRTEAEPMGAVRLEGVCPVEDAETLLGLLLADLSTPVDWTGCTRLHTAVYQVVLRLRPPVLGPCGDPFVARWLPEPPGRGK